MREPIGTTQRGQVMLGVVGFTLGIGGGLGLEVMPGVFEPLLRAVLAGLSFVQRTHFHYDPSERTLFAILLGIVGIVWALLFAHAFAGGPARDRAIDNYLRQKNNRDTAPRTRYISDDDSSV